MSLLLWLARFAGRSARELTPLLKSGEAEWLAEKKAVAIDDLPLTLRADLPEWIVERLQRQWPD
jgi:16S rRNA (cytosine967-C5)-methyltransferase